MNYRGRHLGASLIGNRKTRRGFLQTAAVAGAGALVALSAPSLAIGRVALAAEEPMAGPSADEVLKRLMEGNARYVAMKQTYPDQTMERRTEVAKGQMPFAIVLGCADSRVTPELAFDQGLGDLFVVRVAGNILDDNALGSIEYALEEYHVPLLIVLGHERCGAVKATLDLSMTGDEAPGHIQSLVKAINPAVAQAKTQDGDTLDLAVVANVGNAVAQLKTSEPIIGEFFHHEKLKIVGARYDLDTGEVTVIA